MTADDTPLWPFADQLGPRMYGGEHAHRPILLVEAASALRRYGRPVLVHEPTSLAAEKFVRGLCSDGLLADILPTPMFALPRAEFRRWAGDRTRFRLEDF